MVIFNSYVSLPEGIKYATNLYPSMMSPKHPHCPILSRPMMLVIRIIFVPTISWCYIAGVCNCMHIYIYNIPGRLMMVCLIIKLLEIPFFSRPPEVPKSTWGYRRNGTAADISISWWERLVMSEQLVPSCCDLMHGNIMESIIGISHGEQNMGHRTHKHHT